MAPVRQRCAPCAMPRRPHALCLSIMTLSDPIAPASPCPCGSGLRHARCCGLDWTAPWPDPGLAPELGRARAALAAGDQAEAGRLLVELLEKSPKHIGAITLLYELRSAQTRTAAAEALLKRIVRLDPNNLKATQALALLLFTKGALAEAEVHARNAVRIAPTDAQSHNLMGMIMTEAQRPQVGEHHYRQAMKLIARPSAILLANLAWNLKNQGRMAESRALYEDSVRVDPAIFQTLYGWARMEETDRNFARAGELLDAAEELSPGNPSVLLQRAILKGRIKDYDSALAALDDIERRREGGGLGPIEASEKGLLLDKMGRYADAFAAFTESKRTLRALTGQAYLAEEAAALVRRLKAFFVAPRLKILPRAGIRSDVAQPIFIVGFPRSGTTMIEQTLERPPADQRRRRTADRRRAHRPHPAHAQQSARLSGGLCRTLARRPDRGARQSARLLSSARPPARRDRQGRPLVHRQDAAQRDASWPHRAHLPEGADHPPLAPSARRRALGVFQPSDARLLLRLRPRQASHGTMCSSPISSSTIGAK